MSEESDLYLDILGPSGPTQRVELEEPLLTIGRSPECRISLESAKISRKHAELSRDGNGNWTVKDLGSRNGTRVNGRPVTEQALQAGDKIQVGDFELRLRGKSVLQPHGQGSTAWSAREGATTAFMTLVDAPVAHIQESHLALVSNLSSRLIEIPDPQQRMILLCRTLVESDVRCDSAVVLRANLMDANQPPVTLCAHQMRAGSQQSLGTTGVAEISRAVVDAAVSSQQPILAGGEGDQENISASIVCPLRVEAKEADILYVTVPRHHGTVDWLALVALAAEQFKKAELQIESRQTVKVNAELHHDLGKARQMQMSLVPKNPAVPGLEIAIGFEPCNWIGGDYANVLPISDGRVLLAIADACGKGMAAAMIASGVHSIVHSSIRAGSKLDAMVQSLNQYLLESMDRQSFVTMIGAMVDPRTGKATCFNAGHPPMLVIEPNGHVTEMRYGHNPPLGVMPMTIELDNIELKPGQLLVLFTDGLSEMRNPQGRMLGLDGVKSRLSQLYADEPGASLKDLADRLTKTLDEIRGEGTASDDRTFLLARRGESH
jgi:phosphoserine phosphatase RsbU/P